MRTCSGILMLLGLLLLLPSLCSARIYVDCTAQGDGSGSTWTNACTTIQAGIDDAGTNGTVWVADGAYYENVDMGGTPPLNYTGVKIYGGFAGGETSFTARDYFSNIATIDGGENGSCVTMAENAIVDGFTITNGSGTLVGAYYCGGGF